MGNLILLILIEMAALIEIPLLSSLEAEIPKYSTNFVKLNELMKEKEGCEAKLEEKMDRWMYLEDLAARIKEQEV